MGEFDCCRNGGHGRGKTMTFSDPFWGDIVSRRWSFGLAYSRAPKGLNLNDRAHWAVKAKSTETVRLQVMAAVRHLKVPVLYRAQVDVEWIVNTKARRDTDNLAPFMKAIYDGIGADKGVSAHIVEDDAPQFMLKTGATIRYEKTSTPHFVVTITEIGAMK